MGWFPATNVVLMEKGGKGLKDGSTSTAPMGRVVAQYPYTSKEKDELTFAEGDVIEVLAHPEPDWWRGALNGITGLFPVSYVIQAPPDSVEPSLPVQPDVGMHGGDLLY